MLIPRTAFGAAKIADIASSRYALGGVQFQRSPDGSPLAVATDGRRLVALTWPEPDPAEFPPMAGLNPAPNLAAKVIIPAKVCLDAGRSKLGLKSKKPVLHYVALDENTSTDELPAGEPGPLVPLAATDLERIERFDSRPVNGRFPRWADCIPAYGESDISVSLDAQYLRELLAVLESHTDGRVVVLSLSADKPHEKAVLLTAVGNNGDGTKAVGVLMPLSFGDYKDPKPAKPAWDFHKHGRLPAEVAAIEAAEAAAVVDLPVVESQAEVDTVLEHEVAAPAAVPVAFTAAAGNPPAVAADPLPVAAEPEPEPEPPAYRPSANWRNNAAAVLAAVHV
jgi:hypothetical protein